MKKSKKIRAAVLAGVMSLMIFSGCSLRESSVSSEQPDAEQSASAPSAGTSEKSVGEFATRTSTATPTPKRCLRTTI